MAGMPRARIRSPTFENGRLSAVQQNSQVGCSRAPPSRRCISHGSIARKTNQRHDSRPARPPRNQNLLCDSEGPPPIVAAPIPPCRAPSARRGQPEQAYLPVRPLALACAASKYISRGQLPTTSKAPPPPPSGARYGAFRGLGKAWGSGKGLRAPVGPAREASLRARAGADAA